MARLRLDMGGATRTFTADVRPTLERKLKQLAGKPVDAAQLEALVKDLTRDGKLSEDENLVAFALSQATTGDAQITFEGDSFETKLDVPAASLQGYRDAVRAQLAGIGKPSPAVPIFLSGVIEGQMPPTVALNEVFPPPPPPMPELPPGVTAEVVVVSARPMSRPQKFSEGFKDTKLAALPAGAEFVPGIDIADRDNDKTERAVRTFEYLRRLGVELEVTLQDFNGDTVTTRAAVLSVEGGSQYPAVNLFMADTDREQSVQLDQLAKVKVLQDVPAVNLKSLPKARPLPPLTLAKVELEKEIAASGLTPEQVQVLRGNGANLTTVYDFVKQREEAPPKRSRDLVGVGLYIQREDIVKRAIDEAAGLVQWDLAYYQMGMQPYSTGLANHTEVFLEMVTQRKADIVFFVPENLMNDPNGVFTKKEMSWFLEHPDRLAGVTFVFGTEKALDFDDYKKLASAYSDRNQMWGAIVHALKQGPTEG